MSLNWQPVNSSNVEAMAHDPVSKVLSVRFKGGKVYEYDAVSPEEHAALFSAPSVGSHFHAHFRKRGGRKVS